MRDDGGDLRPSHHPRPSGAATTCATDGGQMDGHYAWLWVVHQPIDAKKRQQLQSIDVCKKVLRRTDFVGAAGAIERRWRNG